jgi:L-threonylcarbamoyladenylate synthase
VTEDVEVAAAALRNGGLVAFPTETVYGLGAVAVDDTAVQRIFTVKGRPAGHPLIVHLLDSAAARQFAQRVPDYADRLIEEWWPGPLTVIVPRRPDVATVAAAGAPTIALRSPSHPVARELLAALAAGGPPDTGWGIAAPSANRFGRVSPTSAAHVMAELGLVLNPRLDRILDGGPCDVGIESTIVDCTGPRPVILRLGRVDATEIAAACGLEPDSETHEVAAPGTLESHYAPSARVLVCETDTLDAAVREVAPKGEIGLLAPSDVADQPGTSRLERPADAAEFARVLYASLRAADDAGLATVIVIPPPPSGLGLAIRDRLVRAARGGGGQAV